MSRSRSTSLTAGSGAPPEQPLNVKVLRLSRPQLLNTLNPIDVEAPSLLTPELLLPKSVNSVFAGEELQCLVAVQKTGSVDEDSVSVLVEMVSPRGGRTRLLESGVSPAGEFTRLVSFDVTESGSYSLSVLVRYERSMEHRAFRRLFKFEASPAISVRTKVSRSSSAMKGHVLEAQVENMSDAALTIESCVLSSTNSWEVTRLEPLAAEANVLLRPRDIHQWCFVMRDGREQDVGNLSVGWRREPLGAKGWQTTGMIRI